jgi:primosomal protein N'
MTAAPTCAHCGAPSDISRLCDECTDKVVAAERAAQGLPRMLEDPVVIARLASIGSHRLDVAS